MMRLTDPNMALVVEIGLLIGRRGISGGDDPPEKDCQAGLVSRGVCVLPMLSQTDQISADQDERGGSGVALPFRETSQIKALWSLSDATAGGEGTDR
jgi:hypothetical protein